MICKKEHRYNEEFDILPESQKVLEARHKCAGCAYEQGHEHGSAGEEPNFKSEEIDFSQAGIVRHKSPQAAYNLGYSDGLRERVK